MHSSSDRNLIQSFNELDILKVNLHYQMLRLIAYISERLRQEDWYNEEQLATKMYRGLCVLMM